MKASPVYVWCEQRPGFACPTTLVLSLGAEGAESTTLVQHMPVCRIPGCKMPPSPAEQRRPEIYVSFPPFTELDTRNEAQYTAVVS